VPQDWNSIGTDGFGLSDTREAVRRHFGVDPQSIVVAALAALARRGEIEPGIVAKARAMYAL
jgi:pyruvate dehydrogenase E1 component